MTNGSGNMPPLQKSPIEMPSEPLSLEDYKAFFETLGKNVISSATDANGDIIYANDKFVEVSKYTRKELFQQNHRILKSGFHEPEFYTSLWKTITSGKVWRGEIKNRAKDGTYYWVDTSIAPILGKNGKPEKYVSVRFLITERKQVEEELERRKEHSDFLAGATTLLISSLEYETVLKHMAELLVPRIADWCVIDLKTDQSENGLRRMATSHRDHSQLGILHRLQDDFPPDPKKTIGAHHVFKANQSEFYPEVSETYLEASAQSETHLQLMKKLGIKSLIRVPLQNRGRALGVITLVRTSPIKKFTTGDLELIEELGRRSGIAIENARLYRQLQEADRRKDEFIATLAHELRNPLSPLILDSELLKTYAKKNINDPEFTDTVASVARQSKTMSRLLDDLLDISRLVRGKITLQKEHIDIGKLVDRAIETTRPYFEAQEVRLTLPPLTRSLEVYVDPVRIEQVFVNLLHNAAKYNKPGGHVAVSFENSDNSVRIHVKDDGIGIHRDILPKIFDIFTQAEKTGFHQQGGLGIGLALAKNFVQMHSGVLSAESNGEGKGSEFTVELPMANQKQNPFAAKILVADDNQDAARALVAYLKHSGYSNVHTAKDGEQAIAIGKSFRPDFVLMDIRMPVMDGYTAARLMRRDQNFRDAILIAVTGYGQEEDRKKSEEAGFEHHFTKPVDIVKLLGILSKSYAA